MSDLSAKLRKYAVNAKEWYDMDVEFLTEAADALEARDKTIAELREELLKSEYRADSLYRANMHMDRLLSQAQSKDKAE